MSKSKIFLLIRFFNSQDIVHKEPVLKNKLSIKNYYCKKEKGSSYAAKHLDATPWQCPLYTGHSPSQSFTRKGLQWFHSPSTLLVWELIYSFPHTEIHLEDHHFGSWQYLKSCGRPDECNLTWGLPALTGRLEAMSLIVSTLSRELFWMGQRWHIR